MEVLNKIILGKTCRQRRADEARKLVIHRNTVGTNATEVAKWYREHPIYTGGKMPYHVLIHKDGVVEQAVALARIAPAALKLNRRGIQIACIGDFRKHPPMVEQAKALTQVCKQLCQWIGVVDIVGHTDEAGSTAMIGKVCPGKHLNVKGMKTHILSDFQPYETSECVHKLKANGWVIW